MTARPERAAWHLPVACSRPPRAAIAGFTLVELMIVIAVMVVLMAIVVPSYRVMSANSERNTCAANLKAIGQALALFREDYGCFPPDETEYLVMPTNPEDEAQAADVIHAAYDPVTGAAVDTGVHGLGLYTLYYLGIYSAALPPLDLEPELRLSLGLRTRLGGPSQHTPKGLNGLLWFRGGGYITKLDAYHCPGNRAKLYQEDLTRRPNPEHGGLPSMGGWNNYDVNYRRNFWEPGTRIVPPDESRHLLQPYPPVDTVVTWCTHHRSARPPAAPGEPAPVNAGDKDLVLFADGSVRWMASRADNRMFEASRSDSGWPAGPVM